MKSGDKTWYKIQIIIPHDTIKWQKYSPNDENNRAAERSHILADVHTHAQQSKKRIRFKITEHSGKVVSLHWMTG